MITVAALGAVAFAYLIRLLLAKLQAEAEVSAFQQEEESSDLRKQMEKALNSRLP